ncbi:MAG: 4Fe-4S dicluster domain-containing protein [Gammaproteobacteria bacterium]|nr:4Fe-4S dicluster domain-containing protein [Gammaproteobacteria bacterium]
MIEKTINFSRRVFVEKTATVAAAVTIAPGVFLHQVAQAKPADQAVTSAVRWGMLIDTNKCATGCTACVSACNEENGIQSHDRPATDQQWIRKVKLRDTQTGHITSLPMMCQHCEKPPCVDVCPTGASMKREDGIVLVDKHICIGCRYCMMACPYKARSFAHETVTDQKDYAPRGKGTVEACTLCVHRVDEGGTPACVEACNAAEHGAMIFGDLKDPESNISKELEKHGGTQLRADLRLNTGVRYQGI